MLRLGKKSSNDQDDSLSDSDFDNDHDNYVSDRTLFRKEHFNHETYCYDYDDNMYDSHNTSNSNTFHNSRYINKYKTESLSDEVPNENRATTSTIADDDAEIASAEARISNTSKPVEMEDEEEYCSLKLQDEDSSIDHRNFINVSATINVRSNDITDQLTHFSDNRQIATHSHDYTQTSHDKQESQESNSEVNSTTSGRQSSSNNILKENQNTVNTQQPKNHSSSNSGRQSSSSKTNNSAEMEDHFDPSLFNHNIHHYLRNEIPRPTSNTRPFTFTLYDKLKKSLNNGNATCRCGQENKFYEIGDTMNIAIVTNQLAHLSQGDSKHERALDCSHFEVIQILDSNLAQIAYAIHPVIKYLRQFFKIEILASVGDQDFLNTGMGYPMIRQRFVDFEKCITDSKCTPKTTLKSQVGLSMDISVRFVTIPYMPAVSTLKYENHKLRNYQNRTDQITSFNKKIVEYNQEISDRLIPTMHQLGLTDDPFVNMSPDFNKHDYSQWFYPRHKISLKTGKPDFMEAQDITILKNGPRLRTWTWFHSYFCVLNVENGQN